MPEPLLVAKSDTELCLLPRYANRHGLIAGATGTGKTATLQRIAEGLSRLGVPVFMADVKGDLATLMGLQAGLPALDFGGIRGETKRRYIGAVHAALDRDYRLMTATFRGVIARSLRTQVTASSARGRS